jgi:hypothetical protein
VGGEPGYWVLLGNQCRLGLSSLLACTAAAHAPLQQKKGPEKTSTTDNRPPCVIHPPKLFARKQQERRPPHLYQLELVVKHGVPAAPAVAEGHLVGAAQGERRRLRQRQLARQRGKGRRAVAQPVQQQQQILVPAVGCWHVLPGGGRQQGRQQSGRGGRAAQRLRGLPSAAACCPCRRCRAAAARCLQLLQQGLHLPAAGLQLERTLRRGCCVADPAQLAQGRRFPEVRFGPPALPARHRSPSLLGLSGNQATHALRCVFAKH